MSKTTKLKKLDKSRSVYANRNILDCLVSFSVKHEKAVDIKKALQYPLSPVPLSIATADESNRGTKKSELLAIIKDKIINENTTIIPDTSKVLVYILDFIAFERTVTDNPSIFEDLTWRVIKQIPIGYNRVDIVADTYRPVSIKMQERDCRLWSVISRTTCDFKEFLSDGENKSKLITLIFEYFVI